jgi:hypothetical protein
MLRHTIINAVLSAVLLFGLVGVALAVTGGGQETPEPAGAQAVEDDVEQDLEVDANRQADPPADLPKPEKSPKAKPASEDGPAAEAQKPERPERGEQMGKPERAQERDDEGFGAKRSAEVQRFGECMEAKPEGEPGIPENCRALKPGPAHQTEGHPGRGEGNARGKPDWAGQGRPDHAGAGLGRPDHAGAGLGRPDHAGAGPDWAGTGRQGKGRGAAED